MKKLLGILVFALTLFQIFSLTASEINLDQKIPFDQEIVYGKLDNGLTYYIKKNTTPKKKARIDLIIKAGSLMEDDDQLGLAHLIEHMVFNGTKDYPKNKIDEYFNSIGLSIGADFNAFTGFEKTVYTFSIPTEKTGFIEQGIHILSDISNFANLNDQSFEKERKIVEEEWRGSLGKDKRLFDEIKKVYFLNSKFAKRLPIGDIDIIRNFTYETAIRYYNDWYRPDLMAVVAVGDFDEKYVEELIKKYFSKIKSKNKKRDLPVTIIPNYNKSIYVVQSDPEQEESEIRILTKNKSIKLETLRDVRISFIGNFCSNIVQKKLSNILTDNKTPLLSTYIGRFNLTLDNEFHIFAASLKEKEIKEGVNFLLTEIERVKQNGFLLEDLENEKKEQINYLEQSLEADKTRETNSIVDELSRNFLENEFVTGVKNELEITKQLLTTISIEDLNEYFQNWFNYNDRIINVILPDKLKNSLSEEDFLAIEAKVKKGKYSQFKSLIKDEPLIKEELSGSKIITIRKYPSVKTIEFRLENGVRVFLKPTKNKEKSFYFKARSMGGYSHAKLEDLFSTRIVEEAIDQSHLGNFSRIELDNKISSSFADVNIILNNFQEGLSGQAVTKNTKELFELIYLNFTSVNFNQTVIENIKISLREDVRNENLNPDTIFFKKLIHAYYKGHPRKKPLTLKDIDQISLDKVTNFYKDRFSDASDFVFTFVGDFKVNEMKPYIEKYLGSLPSINRQESFIDHKVRIEDQKKNIIVKENSENKSTNYRIYNNLFKNNIKNRSTLYVLENILNRILHERIRENQNLVYYIGAHIDINYFPTQNYSLYISFSSDSKNNDLIFKKIDEILQEFKKTKYDKSYIEDAKLNRINSIKESLQSNVFLASAMNSYLFEDQPITTINQLKSAAKSVSSWDIMNYAKRTFTDNFIQASLLPKEN